MIPVKRDDDMAGRGAEHANPVSEARLGVPLMRMGAPPGSADAIDVAADRSSKGQYALGVGVELDIRPRYIVPRRGVEDCPNRRRMPAAVMSTQISVLVESQLSGHAGISPQNRYDLSSPLGTDTRTWVFRPIFP